MTTGIDVSNHQGTVDWGKVHAAGHRFAWCKATEGTTFTDAYWARNREQAAKAGVRVGAYHFARGQTGEVDHFLSVARPRPGELLPVLDVEAPGISAGWVKSAILNLRDGIGEWPVVYGSPGYLSPLRLDASLAACPLWVAHYTNDPNPIVPSPWGMWTAWQHSSDGSVPGISGRVDLNRLRTELDAITYRPMVPPVEYGVWIQGPLGLGKVVAWARRGDDRVVNKTREASVASALARHALAGHLPRLKYVKRKSPPQVGKRL